MRNKFECLIHEILFIQELNPSLNEQSDFLPTESFTYSRHARMSEESFLICIHFPMLTLFSLDNDVTRNIETSAHVNFVISFKGKNDQ